MQGRRPGRYQRHEGLPKSIVLDYKNIDLLSRLTDDDGRIRSRRRTSANAKQQRALTRAVKLARYMALLPYTSSHVRDFSSE